MMNGQEIKRWIDLLERLSAPVLDPLDAQEQLARALAKPESLAGPLIAHCLAISDVSTPVTVFNDSTGRFADVALWWGLFDARINSESLIDLDGDGPLFDAQIGRTFATIEVWTEAELAGLHAVWHHSRLADRFDVATRDRMTDRITRTVMWHIENTQPDNATCHPWAVHVFLMHNTPESRHFAETQLSNCLVSNARPDVLSAWILRDSANALRTTAARD